MLNTRLCHNSFGNSINNLTVQQGNSSPGSSDTDVLTQEKCNGITWSVGVNALMYKNYARSIGSINAGIVTGGYYSGQKTSCETFDGSTWSNYSYTITARDQHSIVGNSTTCIIHGGRNTSSIYLNSCQYKSSNSAWSNKPALLQTRYSHVAIGNTTTCIVIGGGPTSNSLTVEKYNGTNWSLLSAKINNARTGFSAVGSISDCIIQGGSIKICEKYNGNVWISQEEQLNAIRYYATAIGENSRSLIITGGKTGGLGSYDSTEICE